MSSYMARDTLGIYKTHNGPGPDLMGAGTLTGNHVHNAQDDHIGEIVEIMLDMRTGTVAYAVMSFGGFLGMGDKLFAVPWSALILDTVNERFVLNIDKERIATAPGFDKDAWPDMSDAAWVNELHQYYDIKPYQAPPLQ